MLVKSISVVIFSLLCTSSHSCNPNHNCFIDTKNENIQKLLASADDFTARLIQKLHDSQGLESVSPMSVYVMLVLMAFGSAGDTRQELIRALNLPNADLQQLGKSFGDILIASDSKRSEMVGTTEDDKLESRVIEGLFVQKDFTLVDEYADYLSALNIKIQPVDFANNAQAAQTAITDWIAANKIGKNSMSSSYSSNGSTRIYLASMFHFAAKWKDNLFLDREPGLVPFHPLNNQVISVSMMKASASLLYYDKKDSFTAVEVPYEGGQYRAVFILPYRGVDAVKFVTSFSMDIVKEFLANAELKNIDCQIPTFSRSYSFGLVNLLGGLGVKQLFAEVDLSKMLKLEKQNLGVQISHDIELAVNQKGTTADSLTVVPVKKTIPTDNLVPFIADHPFLMLIRSIDSLTIAFATFFQGGSNTFFAGSSGGVSGSW